MFAGKLNSELPFDDLTTGESRRRFRDKRKNGRNIAHSKPPPTIDSRFQTKSSTDEAVPKSTKTKGSTKEPKTRLKPDIHSKQYHQRLENPKKSVKSLQNKSNYEDAKISNPQRIQVRYEDFWPFGKNFFPFDKLRSGGSIRPKGSLRFRKSQHTSGHFPKKKEEGKNSLPKKSTFFTRLNKGSLEEILSREFDPGVITTPIFAFSLSSIIGLKRFCNHFQVLNRNFARL